MVKQKPKRGSVEPKHDEKPISSTIIKAISVVAAIAVLGLSMIATGGSQTNRLAQNSLFPTIRFNPVHITSLPRERAAELTREQFEDKYGRPGKPVVIQGAAAHWEGINWSPERLDELCGKQKINEPCAVGGAGMIKKHKHNLAAHKWGGMNLVDSKASGLDTMRDFLEAQEEDSDLYMHDAPINAFCPRLLDDIRVPRYFPMDLQQHMPLELRNRHLCSGFFQYHEPYWSCMHYSMGEAGSTTVWVRAGSSNQCR